MPASDKAEATELLFGMGALMSDLKRLEARAMSQGFLIAATLIGAAAEAVADEIDGAVSTDSPPGEPRQAKTTQASDGLVMPTRERLQ